jgi:hypothetical protein
VDLCNTFWYMNNTMTAVLHVRVPEVDKARWASSARAEGMSLSAWVVSRLNGDGPGALARQAIEAVEVEAPAVVERIARDAVRESLGESSVTHEDFVDFGAEV